MKLLLLILLLVLLTQCTKGTVEAKEQTAYFAGGCFWCMEQAFEDQEAITQVISGFSGGEEDNPSYEDVAYGKTSHREVVEVHYDPNKITYKQLLDVFFRHVDPTDSGGQFADRGFQYSTAIYYQSEEEKQLAETAKETFADIFQKPIVTEILPFKSFHKAEEYHQDYHKKNPLKYKLYKKGSGRTDFLKQQWSE